MNGGSWTAPLLARDDTGARWLARAEQELIEVSPLLDASNDGKELDQ